MGHYSEHVGCHDSPEEICRHRTQDICFIHIKIVMGDPAKSSYKDHTCLVLVSIVPSSTKASCFAALLPFRGLSNVRYQ